MLAQLNTPEMETAAESDLKKLLDLLVRVYSESSLQRSLVRMAHKNRPRFYKDDVRAVDKLPVSYFLKLSWWDIARLLKALVLSPGEIIP